MDIYYREEMEILVLAEVTIIGKKRTQIQFMLPEGSREYLMKLFPLELLDL